MTVHQSEANNSGGGPGNFCWFFFHFMYMISDSRHGDLKFFLMSFKHWPRWNGQHFADSIFKCIFSNENVLISIKISLKFVPKGPINNIPALLRWWLGADQAISHYLNHWWFYHQCKYASLSLNELTYWHFWDAKVTLRMQFSISSYWLISCIFPGK